MGKGSNTTTTVQQVPPQVLANYQQAFDTASAAAQAPYAPYTGQIVADLSGGQNYAIQNYATPTQAYQANQPGIGAYVTANAQINEAARGLNQAGVALNQSQNYLNTAGNTYGQAANIIASQPEYNNAAAALSGVDPYLNQSSIYTQGASPTISAGLGSIAGAQPYVGQAANAFQTGLNTVAGAQPYVGQAANTFQTGLNTVAGAQPYVGQAANAFQTGLGTISSAQPYVGQAANTIAGASGNYALSQQELLNSTAPIWSNTMQYNPQSINSFYSPYVNDVVNATQAQFNNQNAIQQQQVIGNAAAEGAWGGDRSAVAQGIVAGQQQVAEAPVIAGLENTGFTQAQQEFNAQQQAQLGALETTGWLTSQAGTGLAGLGTAQVGQGAAQLGAAQTQQGIGAAQVGAGQAQLGAAQTQQGIGQAQAAIGQGQLGAAQTQQGIGTAQAGIGQGQLGAAQTQQGIGTAELSGAQAQLQQAQEAAQQASLQTGVGQAYTNLGAGVVGQGQALGNIGAGQVGVAGGEQGITGQQIAAAGQMGNIAGQQTNANNAQVNYATQLYNAELGAINAGMSTGALAQAEQQAQLNVPYQIYTAGQAYPFQTSQFLTSAAEGLNPGGGTSTTTAPAPSPLSGIGGLLTGIAGIGGLIASDERAKEDIQQIGKASPEHGGGAIYSFRYKGDPTTHIGQMAQEVERRRPDAVHEGPDGLKMVDYHAATEARKIGGRIDPAHGDMPSVVSHGIKPALGLGPRHRMRLAQGGEVIPSGIVGWRQGEQKFQSGGTPTSIIPGMTLPGMTGAMASPISPVLPSTKIPDLTVSVIPPPGQGGHAGVGPPPPPTVQPGSAASGTLAGLGAAMPSLVSAASGIKNFFNQGTSQFSNTGWMPNSQAITPFANAAAQGLYNDPAASEPVPTLSGSNEWFARGGRTYDDGGDIPNDTMADALKLDPGSGIGGVPILTTPQTIQAQDKAQLFASPSNVPSNWETRHNNFGGMRIPGVNAGPNAGGFQSFDTPEQGVAAISHQLDRYASGATTGRPLTTLNDIVSTWAPPSENDTGFLINRASKIMGVAPNQQLDLSDPGVKARLIEATIRNEMGGALPVDPKIISDVASGAIPYTGTSPSRGISPRAPIQLASADGAQVYAIPEAPSSGIAGMPTGSHLVEQTAEGKPSGLDALRAKGVDPWLALAIAGFATAAGRSPFPMQNIGAGFLEGAKYIQQQTAAYPEQQLKREQAQQVGYQLEGMRAYRRYWENQLTKGQQPSVDDAAGALDSSISATARGMQKSAENGAIQTQALQPLPTTPTGGTSSAIPTQGTPPSATPNAAQQPAPGAPQVKIPPMTAEEAATSQRVKADLAQIQAQINQTREQMPFAVTPEQGTALQNRLTNLQFTYFDKQKQDPEYIRAAKLAEGAGALPYNVQSGRPGSYILQGGTPVGAVPEWKTQIIGGKQYGYWATPPLPGAVAAGSAQPPLPGTAPGVPAGAIQTELSPGEHETQTAQARHEQDQRDKVIQQANDAQLMQATFQNMNRDADKFYQGPLSHEVAAARGFLRLLDPSQTQPVAAYEDFVKNAGSITRTAVHDTSSRAAAQEYSMIQNTLPAPTMSPQGLRQVTNEYMGINDYRIAKSQAQKDWEDTHNGQVHGFETDFQARLTPSVFIMRRMDPTTQMQAIEGLNRTEAGRALIQKLRAEAAYLKASGIEGTLQ